MLWELSPGAEPALRIPQNIVDRLRLANQPFDERAVEPQVRLYAQPCDHQRPQRHAIPTYQRACRRTHAGMLLLDAKLDAATHPDRFESWRDARPRKNRRQCRAASGPASVGIGCG